MSLILFLQIVFYFLSLPLRCFRFFILHSFSNSRSHGCFCLMLPSLTFAFPPCLQILLYFLSPPLLRFIYLSFHLFSYCRPEGSLFLVLLSLVFAFPLWSSVHISLHSLLAYIFFLFFIFLIFCTYTYHCLIRSTIIIIYLLSLTYSLVRCSVSSFIVAIIDPY